MTDHHHEPDLTIASLWNIFPEDGLGPAPHGRAVAGEDLPGPHRRLLIHKRHMTVILREHHDADVDLHVLARRHDGDLYARRLILTVSGTDLPVLFGIMRIHLENAPAAAREEILAEETPLGAILIGHGVLRRLEPVKFLEITPTAPMARLLRVSTLRPLYGRLAQIHCGGERAVDLLEVVAP